MTNVFARAVPMTWIMIVAAVCGVAIAAASADAQTMGKQTPAKLTPDVADRLANHLTPHPRLLLTGGEFKSAVARIDGNPRLSQLRARLLADADVVLGLPPLQRTLTGRRLLLVSRDALHRVATLSLAYRFTGDRKYLDGATGTMKTIAAFDDFNPSHFLDTAEMTTALAIGYDWLYTDLPDVNRARVRRAIIDKGLRPSFAPQSNTWVRGRNNWNQVCNGGMTLGALAIAEDEPALAKQVIDRAVDSLPYAMKAYAPDGAFPEGPIYWEYGTTYNLLLATALQSAIGSDLGLLPPDVLKSGDYHLQTVGPTGLNFNYSDNAERSTRPSAPQFLIAARRGQPGLLFEDLKRLDTLLTKPPAKTDTYAFEWLTLIWTDGQWPTANVAPAATHYAADGITPIAVHRSSWQPEATFVAVKGGSPGASHAHMDAGAFALDWGGQRWASDLGMQNYNSLESRGVRLWDFGQHSQRWQVYRIGPTPHNILTIDGQEQRVDGRATIVKSTGAFTILNTGPVYAGQLSEALRGVMLRPDGSVRLQDELRATERSTTATASPATTTSATPPVVRWTMLTTAAVAIDGPVATLTQGGKTMRLHVVSPANATLQIVSTAPPRDTDVANPGTRLITFDTPLTPGEPATLAIDFTPGDSAQTASPPVAELSAW